MTLKKGGAPGPPFFLLAGLSRSEILCASVPVLRELARSESAWGFAGDHQELGRLGGRFVARIGAG
jgi:hypothetical protein